MEIGKLKNLDKQVVGCSCYSTANAKWCDIIEVYSDYCVVRDVVTKAIYEERRENLYPLAENVVTRDYGLDLCHEIVEDIQYPYYCPADDENYYDFEVVKKTKQDDTKDEVEEDIKEDEVEEDIKEDEVEEAEYANVRIDRKNVRTILDTIIKGLETEFNEEFLHNSGEMSSKFIRDAIYGMYDPEDDITLQEIFSLYNDNALYGVVCDLFNEHFLHICQNNLITLDLMKAIDQTTLETLLEEVNSLGYPVLDKIYHNDTEAIKEYRKKLGIDALMDKYLKKTYKVKGVIAKKYIVEVQASNWGEAKKKALDELDETFLKDSCNFIESEPIIVNWK